MTDGDTVDTENLDTFSDLFFSNKTPEVKETVEENTEEVEEASEIETPSATEGDESEEVADEAAETGDDAPADESADGEDEIDEEDEHETPLLKVKSRKPARERINELTAKSRAAEREIAELRRKLDEQINKPAPDVKAAATTPLEDTAPNPDTKLENGDPVYPLGEFDPTYIRDLTRHTIQQESKAAKAEAEKEQRTREIASAEQELLSSWDEKLEKVSKRLPNLNEKAADLEEAFLDLDPNYAKFLAATIMSLDYGPDVLSYLADNPSDARKIITAGPTKATVALGRIEARFAFADEKNNNEVVKEKVVKPTAAPNPPPKNKGSGGVKTAAPDTDDLDAFEKQFFAKK